MVGTMPFATSVLSWISILALTIPFAILMLIALPTGSVVQLGAHAGLLVCGAGIALALKPRDDDHD
jgi:hypothetical protein